MAKKLEYLVIHCTATPELRNVTSAEIRSWHTLPEEKGGRGWKQVGYTDMIHLNGEIERLVANNEDAYVDGWEITNGAAGYNAVSRHIVYVGGLRNGRASDTRTIMQKVAMKKYVLEFVKKNPSAKVIGHNDLSTKECPCFDVKKWLNEIM